MTKNSPYRLLPEICRADGVMFTQKKSEPKDSAEVSKSLVCGVSVGREERVAERRGVTVWKCVAALALVALAAWLLGLTLVREVQLARMRGELRALRSELQALGVRVRALDKYVEAEKNLVNDLHAYEDEVVADLDSITVLDDSGDAEQMYDEEGEDGESGEGGMYEEYDHMRQQARPVHGAAPLADGSLGAVLNAPPPHDASVAPRGAALAELHRLVRPPPPPRAASGVRSRRDLRKHPAKEAKDPLAAVRNLTSKMANRKYERFYGPKAVPLAEVAPPAPHDLPRDSDHERAEEERGSVRTRRAFVAAHFHGSTSHLNPDLHPHYKGNGLVRVAHNTPHNVWLAGDWTSMRASASTSPALNSREHVNVKSTGVYFVYVQIYYMDEHDTNGWVLHRTPQYGNAETLLQCATTSPPTASPDKPNSCFSAAALLLRDGDRLTVRNTGGDRHALMQPEKSFIGLVKLADTDEDGAAY